MHIRNYFILVFLLIMTVFRSYGEGTKQLMPDSTFSEAGLYFDESTAYTRFGLINCLPNYRLCIHIKNVGETILFGLKTDVNLINYNLRKPDGSIVKSGICPYLPSAPGYIRYFSQAKKGPFPLIGGYTPLSYTITNVADTGDYYFELTNITFSITTDLWDFQVVSGQHTPAVPADTINGRVWSQSWQVYSLLGINKFFNGRFFIYSDDGIVTKLVFNNARVGAVTIFCNPYGCLNSGNFESDRKSKNDNTYVTFPGIAQYKVFLNNPDSTIYPSGVYGEITTMPYIVPDTAFPPCSGNKSIIVYVNKAGKVEVVITLPYGAPATTVNFFAPVVPGTNAIAWDGKDGLGNPVTDGTLINVSVTFVNGLTNLPIWDQEQNENGFLISLIRPVNPSVLTPLIYWDDTQLLASAFYCPVAPQAVNLTGCSPGSIPGYSGCHPWGLNAEDCHDKMINTWWYGSTSVVAFTDIFTSNSPLPLGHGATRCGAGILMLHATVPPPFTVDWYDTVAGGTPLATGDTTFYTPVLQSTKTYYAEARNPVTGCLSATRVPVLAAVFPDPAPTLTGPSMVCRGTPGNLYITDGGMLNYLWAVSPGGTITNGFGTNIITVTWNNGGWQYVSINYTDTNGCAGATPAEIRVAIIPPPDTAGMISGADSVCSGTTGVPYLVEPLTIATTYVWSVPPGVVVTAGAGTNAITVNFPAGATSGTFTVFGTNDCGNGFPSPPFPVTVTLPPMASAGPDGLTCQGIPFTVTQATASGYSRLLWLSGGTGTFSDATLPNPIYTPGDNETGTVLLTLTAFGIHPCGNDTSVMTLNIVPAPAVDAGQGLSSCAFSPVTLADATASGYSSLLWTTSGTGTFSDPAILHPVYIPGAQDLENGQVILSLKVTGSPLCPDEADSVTISLGRQATANAGPDRANCGGNPFSLSASDAQNYASLSWNTSGTGVFNEIHLLHPTYTPGAEDIGAGHVRLILNVVGTGNCPPVSDTLLLNVTAPPSANAGPDEATCQDATVTIIGASVQNYSGILWSHNGNGSLTGANQLTPVYTPSPLEAGIVTLNLTVSGTGSCFADTTSDRMQILIRQPVIVEAGTEQSIQYGATTTLSGSAKGSSGSYSYQWEPAELLSAYTAPNPETMPLTQSVTFFLTMSDLTTGCTGTDSIRVSVGEHKNTEECLVFHNVITPNGDGRNDTWIIDCIENFPLNKALIFDRWGDKINEIENYNNTSRIWNGTNQQGKIIPDGTYYYIVSIKDGGTYSGWVFVRGGNQ